MGPSCLLGILVGGRSSRMGGIPKGRLVPPDGHGTLVERLVRVGRDAGLEPLLVGEAGSYGDLVPAVPRIPDEPPGVGPLGGLHALVVHAGARAAILVGCDMPHVSPATLRRLASHPASEPVVAPRPRAGGPWEPLLARYDSPRVRPVLADALAAGDRSFQSLFARLEVHDLTPDAELERALTDWDTPEQAGSGTG